MALTSIGSQKTPGRPSELTFAGETGLPADNQAVLMVGQAASGATGLDTVINIANVGDLAAASGEVATKFGDGSEIALMVLAAVRANQGGSTFPPLKAVPITLGDSTPSAAAQAAIQKVKADFIVSPWDFQTDTTNRALFISMAETMSGAQRVDNNQFGSFSVGANFDVESPADLDAFDSRFGIGIWKRDTSASTYSLGEVASAVAATLAARGVPYNPADSVTVRSVPAPVLESDWPTVGAGLESEACLNQGWTPLFVKPNGEVAIVRSVTGRLSADGTGTPVVTAYYDVQDFQVLYFWRKTVHARFSQPDFKQAKASNGKAQLIMAEVLRLAQQFESQDMFQFVKELAPFFKIERNASDRHRFDLKTPVNVIPGLHVIATNVEATTLFDTVTI